MRRQRRVARGTVSFAGVTCLLGSVLFAGGVSAQNSVTTSSSTASSPTTSSPTTSSTKATTGSAPGAPAASLGLGAFTVEASASPVLLDLSLPTVLPLELQIGLARSAIKIDNQPLAVVEAAPFYVPLTAALGLLGGPEGLTDLIKKLLPEIIVGLPTILGKAKFTFDPKLIPIPPIPDLSNAPFEKFGCTAYFPGDPHVVACGGPVRNILGLTVRSSSGQASTSGDADDRSKTRADTVTKITGLSNSFLPISIGSIESSVSTRIVNGRVETSTQTVMTDVNVLGLVKFASLRSGATAALGGTADTASSGQQPCQITEAKVADVPVIIDEAGVRVDAVAVDSAGVQAATGPGKWALEHVVSDVLDELGVVVRGATAPKPTIGPDGSSIDVLSDCLEISWAAPESGSRVRVAIGQNTIKLSASLADPIVDIDDDAETPLAPKAEFQAVSFGGHDLRSVMPALGLLILLFPLLLRARRGSFSLPSRR